jgi:D-amino-acid dehydrogenase
VLAAAAGHGVPLVAERGYHLRAAPNAWPLDLPPVVFEDRSIIVTRFSNCVQVAGFMEFGDPDSPPDPRKWRRLERHVAELGLPIKPPFETWMGARPTLPDYLPAIGRSTRAGNLIYAFGHQHLGLTLAPVTAEIIQALVDATAPRFDLAPFDLARFE